MDLFDQLNILYKANRSKIGTTRVLLTVLNIISLYITFNVDDVFDNTGPLLICNATVCFFFLIWGLPIKDYTKPNDLSVYDVLISRLNLKATRTQVVSAIKVIQNKLHKLSLWFYLIFIVWTFYYLLMSFFRHYVYDKTGLNEIQFYSLITIDTDIVEDRLAPILTNLTNLLTSIFLVQAHDIFAKIPKAHKATPKRFKIMVYVTLIVIFIVLTIINLIIPLENSFECDQFKLVSVLIFGVVSCVTFSLFLAKIESYIISIKTISIIILFVYASLQLIYPWLILYSGMDGIKVHVLTP